ncbi:MAG: DNA-directed RNA polymerase subunit alpha [Leptospiraceae bacterium]|nr:DNA-directed RNA polymerase subunit alpha [Leptospiraceae bacterium]
MSTRFLLKGLKRPKQVELVSDVSEQSYGSFVAEPFERGFGVTIGNSLRRALMSSIEGTAITAIRIEGVDHEFSTMNGIEEDVVRLILNLKQVRAHYESETRDEPKVIRLEKAGPGVLKAGDLAIDSSIQILNPDLHLATLNEDAHLVMDLQFERGRGYVPAEVLKTNIDEIGTIPLDAIFSPVQRVNYKIEETRVGQRTDYEKLNLEVWTDGSVSAEDAVAYAAKILKEHLTVFINFEEEEMEDDQEVNEFDETLRQNLDKHIEELELSVRSLSVLKSLEIEFVNDLVKRTEEELKKSRHYSVQCVEEIKTRLSEMGLEFGMRDVFAGREF